MLELFNKEDGKGIYTVKNNKKIYIKEEDLEKINNWCDVNEDWQIIENAGFIENIKNISLTEIKQKYQDIIFSKYSLTDQLNMSNEAIEIMALVSFEKRDYTEAEATRLVEIQTAKAWIDSQRKACQAEIDAL